MKFLGVGSCRRAFESDADKNICVKVAIPERAETGIVQNKNECECFSLTNTQGERFSCFPRVISHSEDFSKIEVEKAERIDTQLFEKFFSNFVDIEKVSDSKFVRADRFKAKVPIEHDYFRWFAFILGHNLEFISMRLMSQLQAEKSFAGALEAIKKFNGDWANAEFKRQGLCDDFLYSYTQALTILDALNACKEESKLCKSLYDLIDCYFAYRESHGIFLFDLWNTAQWGCVKGETADDCRLVVLDMGFNSKLSASEHYNVGRIVPLSGVKEQAEPSVSPDTFNGESLSMIKSPSGAAIKSKFYTKSEYILAEDGAARRIKSLGLPDDGLHPWTDRTVFLEWENLKKVIDTLQKNMLVAKKICFNEDNSLSVYTPTADGWTESLKVDQFHRDPTLGWHVFEVYYDTVADRMKSDVVKAWHPGHAVTHIESQCA